MTTPTLEQTVAFIKEAHAGQVDKAGNPYYLHPMAVMDLMPLTSDEDELHAALLHDVIEDTDTTEQDLALMGYSTKTIRMVVGVSRDKTRHKTYMEFIEAIAASRDEPTIRLKIADINHNTSPERMAQLAENVRVGLGKRYAKAKAALLSALEGD